MTPIPGGWLVHGHQWLAGDAGRGAGVQCGKCHETVRFYARRGDVGTRCMRCMRCEGLPEHEHDTWCRCSSCDPQGGREGGS
jgi:hypothetical protein